MEQNTTNDALDLGAWVGRKQAFALLAGKCSAAHAESLRAMRDSKKYRSLGMSWEEFCPKAAGISRVAADKIIKLLNEFGPQYFELSAVVRITPEEYRRIAPAVTPDGVQHRGRLLEITMHNAPELSEAVQDLRQQTAAAAVVEPAGDDEFDRTLDRARRSLRAAVEGFERASAMELAGDRCMRYRQELRHSSEAICRLMRDQVSGKPASRL